MSKKETNVPGADESSADRPQLSRASRSPEHERQRSIGAVRVLVEGQVQGVGFRYFTRRVARDLCVRGWVRNLADGRVEALAAGEPQALRRFVERLREGPRGGRVQKLDVRELDDAADLGDFEIRG